MIFLQSRITFPGSEHPSIAAAEIILDLAKAVLGGGVGIWPRTML
jgi:hypothetical protein